LAYCLNGEIVCLDKRGRPQFRDLLFHRGEPCFFAFDLLMADGKDLHTERLTDRKHELRRLLLKVPESRMRYVERVEQHGKALFEKVCKMDLEGIVAKHSHGPYITETLQTTWFKIKNRNYSQMEGREKLFERERHQEPTPGWHGCDLACAEMEQEYANQLGNCTIEYAGWSDQSLPCGKLAVARCADCDSSICSDCQMECCSQSFCVQCYDYHETHECSRKLVEGDQGTQERRKAA